ncbi:MAG TPA: hypothetical protein VGX78_21375, partial [Pirellulales bacterium]|nr:hypothetical protein [Pirellulales bacterium]
MRKTEGTATLRHWVLERLTEFGRKPALVWNDQEHCYHDLLDAVARSCRRLAERRIAPGDCVVLRGGYSPGVLSELLALILNRNVIVPVGPSRHEIDGKLLELTRASAVFSFDDDTCSIRSLDAAGDDHPLVRRLRDAGAAGLVLFTSGSTG